MKSKNPSVTNTSQNKKPKKSVRFATELDTDSVESFSLKPSKFRPNTPFPQSEFNSENKNRGKITNKPVDLSEVKSTGYNQVSQPRQKKESASLKFHKGRVDVSKVQSSMYGRVSQPHQKEKNSTLKIN